MDPRRPVQHFGKEASEFTRRQAAGRIVRLEFDIDRTDRYGRTLAYVYLPGGAFLNADILRQGNGHAYTQFPFRYLEQFRAYEREARDTGRGLWAGAEPTARLAEPTPRLPAVTRLSQTDCIDINTADADALERISHIGPDRAQQIVALRRQRPFRAVAELTRVNGIGAARSAHIIQRFGPHSRHASRRFPS